MISRAHRFHGYGSLKYVYQHGQTVRGPMTSLKFITNDKRKTYRLAVVVSKKVSKSAVVRNRIRRRMYEAVRRHQTEIKRPYDMVWTIFSDQLATMPAEDIEKTVRGKLKQAKII